MIIPIPVDGSPGHDTLIGTGTDETFLMLGGDDTVLIGGETGRDEFFGGDGIDAVALTGDTFAPQLEFLAANAVEILDMNGYRLQGSFLADVWDLRGLSEVRNVASAFALGGGHDLFHGSLVGDLVDGGAGDDTLYGGLGNDTFLAGLGDDQIFGGDGRDVFALSGDLAASYLLLDAATSVEAVALNGFTLQGTAAADRWNLSGLNTALPFIALHAGADSLAGSTRADSVEGDEGDDTLFGQGGNDILYGGADNDLLRGGAGDDLLYGGLGADVIYGDLGFDFFYGGGGADTLYGGAEMDQFLINAEGVIAHGGEGDDFFEVTSELDVVGIFGGAGNDSISLRGVTWIQYVSLGAAASVEQLRYSSFDYTNGTSGADVWDLSGVQKISYDIPDYQGAPGMGDGDDLYYGGAAADKIDGEAGNDTLYGGDGDDVLGLSSGRDQLYGGTGNDTFRAAYSSAEPNMSTLYGGDGLDTLIIGSDYDSDGPYTVGIQGLILRAENSVERVTLFRGDAIGVRGSDTGDVFDLSGVGVVSVPKWLMGGGNDLYIAGRNSTSGPAVTVNGEDGQDTLIGGTGRDRLFGGAGSDSLIGNDGGDVLAGDGGNDRLYGGAGQDTLHAGPGDNLLDGGSGNDTYLVETAGARLTIVETAGDAGGSDTVFVSVSAKLSGLSHVEVIELRGSNTITVTADAADNVITATGSGAFRINGMEGDDTITGGIAAGNSLYGGAGDDILRARPSAGGRLDGGTGADTMIGSNGADIYVVDDAGDVVQEVRSAANPDAVDLVQSSVSFTMGSQHIEDLTLTGTGHTTGTGNALANRILGNGGNNTLKAAAGNDTLNGGSGNDTLVGGGGNDALVGGAGADVFVFGRGSGADRINDFEVGVDTIQITGTLTTADIRFVAQGGNTLAMLGTGNSILFMNTSVASLSSFADFDFV